MFKKYDSSNDGYLDLPELKYMMEKLDQAQTHVALKVLPRFFLYTIQISYLFGILTVASNFPKSRAFFFRFCRPVILSRDFKAI